MGYFQEEVILKRKGSTGKLTQLVACLLSSESSHHDHSQASTVTALHMHVSPCTAHTTTLRFCCPRQTKYYLPQNKGLTHCYSSPSSSKKQRDVFPSQFIDPVATVPFPCIALHLFLK